MKYMLLTSLILAMLLTGCGGSDEDSQDDALDSTNTENTADEVQGGQFVLHIIGQVDHLNGTGEVLETIVLDSEIPVNGRLVYEGQTPNDEPRYTLHLEAFNIERPGRTQIQLETDGENNGVIFRELALGLHQPVAGTNFTFPDDLTGDSYGEMVELEYELWTVSEWQASFDHFKPEALTGSVTIDQLDTVASGSLALTVPILSDNTPRVPIGEIQISVTFSDVALENPDDISSN